MVKKNENRQEAIDKGLDTYQGKSCPNKHDGIRYVSNYGCVQCLKDQTKIKYASDPSYFTENRSYHPLTRKKHYDKNKEKIKIK